VRLLPLLAAGLVAFAATPAAAGHGTPSQAGYVSTVSGVEPALPGLLVSILGGDDLLSVRNWSGKKVVLNGPDGKPFLRFEPDAVYRRDRSGWRLVKRGTSYAWHDPRIHWTGPPPERSGLVAHWRIGGTANGEPLAVKGFIGYAAPAPPMSDGGAGLPSWAIVLAGVAGAFVLATALALPLVRRKGEDGKREAATER
jgi:hypothetical protein